MDKMNNRYIFCSERLGFRSWEASDLKELNEMNQDVEVMRYFPKIPSADANRKFILRMQEQYKSDRFCYFVIELLETQDWIGFTGLSIPQFDAPVTPCVDMGWRFKKEYWGKGFATEAAKRSMQYAFEELKLCELKAIAPLVNQPSIAVMERIGMTKERDFVHPLLDKDSVLNPCTCYHIKKDVYESEQ